MLKYWVWLASLPGVGSRAKLQLLEHFSSPEEIYYAQPEELLLTGAVNKAQAQLLADKSLARAEDVLSACAKTGQFIVTMDDTTYPSRLRDIFDPPLLLYGKGSMPLFDDEAAIAVVGTRSCTAYGLDVASQLGYELARQGALVLSGMATGIDGAAMKGALRAGGFTAAVLGGGVDVVYPAENRRIYEDVVATGVVLSEYPPGTEPIASHFPVRNRILSGLSLAAVVVEAPERSGALNTARQALSQGRDVYAVPGNIDLPTFAGSNKLLSEGAVPVTSGWEIVSEYQSLFPDKIRKAEAVIRSAPLPPEPSAPADAIPPKREKTPQPRKKDIDNKAPTPYIDIKTALPALSPEESAIVAALGGTEKRVDDLIAQTGIPSGTLLRHLTMLELKKVIVRLPGNRVVRK